MKDEYRYCIRCDRPIQKIDGMANDKEWQGMWMDGIVEKVSATYGSSLDGDMFVIAVCDDCIQTKLKEKKVIYVGNYMYPDMPLNIFDDENKAQE